MTATSVAGAFVAWLARISGGRAEADLDGASFVRVDGETRDLTVQLGPLLDERDEERSVFRPGHLRLWEVRGVPSALARAGWQVSFRDGSHEVIRLGRDVSALTGHVHVSPTALWKLRRWV